MRRAPLHKETTLVTPAGLIATMLAATRVWLGRTARAIFPGISRRRLKFRGGMFALPIFVLLVLIYPLSLQQAEWVRTADHYTWLALLGRVLALAAVPVAFEVEVDPEVRGLVELELLYVERAMADRRGPVDAVHRVAGAILADAHDHRGRLQAALPGEHATLEHRAR